MGRTRIEDLNGYLIKLAPTFFSTYAKGAVQEDISELEEFARRTFCESYKTFLQFFGRTPAQALNPFLNNRDFEIETIKKAYSLAQEDCEESGYCMPESIIFLSSSDILGEVIYLKQPELPSGDPDIGYLDWETGKLHPNYSGKFEEWLFSLAFEFKLAQFDYMREFESPWNKKDQVWMGQPEQYMKTMDDLGFEVVFEFTNGTVFHESNGVAVMAHLKDTSGRIACNDELKVEKISGLLAYNLNLTISLSPERLRAPKQ